MDWSGTIGTMTEVTSPTAAMADPIRVGREALARHDWQAAYDRFAEADEAGRLAPDDLEAFAQAAFFVARADVGRDARERAFRARLDAGDEIRAAYIALDLGRESANTGKPSIASAWVRRAERILGPEGDTYAHGFLALVRSEMAAAQGDIDAALALAEQVIAIGDRAEDADLRACGLSNLGALKIATGSTADGFALMEEAAFAAVNGELSPFNAGVTCCRMISACRDLRDYQRASEWIEATEKYCQRQSVSGFPGICRIHRAEVAAVGGAWEQAERELERATDELTAYHATPPQADGYYAIGDIRRLKGDFAGAEAALRDAHARGRSPQPALALIRLAEGNAKAAAAAINAAVAEGWDRWALTRLLPAQVEIAIAAGDVAGARAAAERLETIVEHPAPALAATSRTALGRVLLAEGDAAGAVREFRAAIRDWQAVTAPYEVARVRAVLSRALRALDDEVDADLELRAADDEFGRLGAVPDAIAAERELRAIAERRSGPVQVRMTFMFTDIVGSTTLAAALGNEAWERLLRWHDDMLKGLVASGGGEIVNSTGDGFFAAFDSARRAIDCAIAIQRALRDHRDRTGFALAVRIGLHSAEANRRGSDYSGMGVHVAARVTALAGGGESLATADTLAEAGDIAASGAREAEVKGVEVPVRVASVTWA